MEVFLVQHHAGHDAPRDVIDDPYPFYEQLRREAPVWLVPGTQVCVVSSFAAVAEATGRVADFSSRMHHFLYRGEDGLPARLPFGEGTQILAVADPPVHTVHRQVVFPDLMARRMAELEPEVATAAEQCIDASLSAGTVDFMDTVANVVPITMISRLIGFRDHDREALLQAAIDSTALVGGRLSLDALRIKAWPAMITAAVRSCLSLRMRRSRALSRPWSASSRLLAYWLVSCRAPGATTAIARAKAWALSVVISSASPWSPRAAAKNRVAAAVSRLGETNTSMTWPC